MANAVAWVATIRLLCWKSRLEAVFPKIPAVRIGRDLGGNNKDFVKTQRFRESLLGVEGSNVMFCAS